jgi:hypothetical protein
VDAVAVALFGASIGLAGILVALVVTSYQAKRATSRDVRREACTCGFACLAKILRCETEDDHKKKSSPSSPMLRSYTRRPAETLTRLGPLWRSP